MDVGSNGQAGLGDGERADTADPARTTPQPVKGISDAVEVKAGSYGRHFIVRRRNGTLIGWGNSDWGQLGAGISGDFQPAPKPITLPGVEAYWPGETSGSPGRKTARSGSGGSSPPPRRCSVSEEISACRQRCRWRSSSPSENRPSRVSLSAKDLRHVVQASFHQGESHAQAITVLYGPARLGVRIPHQRVRFRSVQGDVDRRHDLGRSHELPGGRGGVRRTGARARNWAASRWSRRTRATSSRSSWKGTTSLRRRTATR